MITLTLLAILVIVAVIATIVTITTGGAVFLALFGDIIFAVLVIVLIVKLFRRKKK